MNSKEFARGKAGNTVWRKMLSVLSIVLLSGLISLTGAPHAGSGGLGRAGTAFGPEEAWAAARPVPVMDAGDDWYEGTTAKSSFTTINIVDDYWPDGTELEYWDASKDNNFTVAAYVSADGKTLTITGNGSGYIKAAGNCKKAFAGFTAVTAINGIEMLDMSDAQMLDDMFYNCQSLVSLNLDDWDVSNVASFRFTFDNCYALTSLGPNNLKDWDTSSVSLFYGAFADCRSLKAIDVSKWDLSSCWNIDDMFAYCSSLTTIDVSKWDVSYVQQMIGTFGNCTSLTSIDVSNWDTSGVTSMNGLFSGCKNLTAIDVSGFDTSSCVSLGLMFYNCEKLASIDVSNWDTLNVENFQGVFDGCESLTSIDVSNWDTSAGTDMSYLFDGCIGLTKLDLGNFNTSSCVDMTSMFSGCTALTEINGLSRWDTSNVEDMTWMFRSCTSIETLDLSTFDTSACTDFTGTFSKCSGLKVLDISSWNTTAAKYMSNLFSECTQLQQVTLGKDFSFTGDGTTSCVLPTPDPAYIPDVTGKWQAVGSGTVSAPAGKVYAAADVPSKVAETYVPEKAKTPVLAANNSWYKGATSKSSIVTISIVDSYTPTGSEKESWDASEAQDGSVRAYVSADGKTLTIAGNGTGCVYANPDSTRAFGDVNWNFTDKNEFSSLTAFNGGDVLDMSKVTNATWMFYNAQLLESIDVSTWDVSNVTVMDSMFGNCYAVKELAVGSWDVSNVTDFTETFMGCHAVTSLAVENWDIENAITLEGIFCGCKALTSLDLSGWDTTGVQDMNNLLSGCQALVTAGDLSGWDTSSCTDMHQMFQNCDALESVDVSNFDTANVADMHSMFYSCLELTTIDVSSWDTSKVGDMSSMFSMCWNLTSLDVSGFDTSKVTDMSSMFANCSELTVIDVSGFETSKVESMGSMFSQCRSVEELDVTGFDTRACADMGYMFYACHGLTSLDLSSFDTATATDMDKMLSYMNRLRVIKLGEDFSFAGSGTTRLTSLPTPDPTYIPGVTGKWQAVAAGTIDMPKGTIYAPDAVPNNVAETYVAELQKTPVLAANNSWYKGTADRSAYTAINLVDSYAPTGSEKESWDASAEQNGSVMAFVSADGKTLTIAGNGSGYVKANADSMTAFDAFASVTTINGLALLDTSGALSMFGFFADNTSLVSLEGIENWDVSNCTTFGSMFSECTSLISLDISKWDMSSAETIGGFLSYCENLVDLKTPTTLAENLINIHHTFESCKKLESVDVSFMCSGKIEFAPSVFQSCESLKTITGYETLVTSSTENISAIFNCCEDLEYLDLSQWVTDNVTTIRLAFGFTYNLETIDGLENWNVSNVEDMSSTFRSCWVLDLSGIYGWDVSSVETFEHTFDAAAELTSLDLSSWSTDAAESMGSMFDFCISLTSLKLGSGFSTENVTDFSKFLIDCRALKVVDLSMLDTSAASDMTDFFTGMWCLQQVTLGENFSFTGNGTTSCVLPTPDPKYIPGATGKWQAVAGGTVSAPVGTIYLPADVPSNVAETYVMPLTTLSVDVPVKVVLAADAEGEWCTPTAEGNRIINHSLLPVRVVSAKAQAVEGFTMLTGAQLAASDASNVFAGTVTAGAGAAQDTAQDLTSIDTSGDAWTMAAETANDDSDLISLQLAGSVANVEGTYFTDGTKLFDVAYAFELVL